MAYWDWKGSGALTPHLPEIGGRPLPTDLFQGPPGAVWLGLLLALGAPAPLLSQEEPPPTSTLSGSVVDLASGRPLQGAAVSLAAGAGSAQGRGTRVTGADGRFTFREVPEGSYRLVVTLLGYHERRDTLQVEAETEVEVAISLSVSPIPLVPLVVEARRRPRDFLSDFQHRRRTRIGTFFDREAVEGRNPYRFTDLLRMVPGVTVTESSMSGGRIRMRGGCRPLVIMDGVRLMTDEGIDEFLLPDHVEAVEVYRGAQVPVEFGATGCGAVVVWTRVGEPIPGRGGFWKRALAGLTFLALGYLLIR